MIFMKMSRKSWGFYLLFIAVMALVMAIVDTVKFANLVDYRTITSENAKTGMMVEGTVKDDWYGPVAYTTDGAEIYFFMLDNDQIIPFSTYREDQIAIFSAYDERTTDNEELEFTGELVKMPPEDKDLMLEILVDEGFSTEEAESILVPFCLENKGNISLYIYILSGVIGLVGFALFLPEFSLLIGRKGSNYGGYERTNYTPTSGNSYQSAYAGTQKSYTGVGTNNNTYSGTQAYGQNTYGQLTAQNQSGVYTGSQSTAQGQNRTYTGSQSIAQGQNRDFTPNQYSTQGQNRTYVGSQSTAQEQNRTYTGSQSTAQGQNRDFTPNQYSTQGQNRTYAGSQSTAQGQNRTYAGSQSTAQGQNRTYTGSQSTAQGQNRDFTPNQYSTQGQNRTYAGSQSTAQGQNRTYTGSQSTAQGQNRDFTNNQDDTTKI